MGAAGRRLFATGGKARLTLLATALLAVIAVGLVLAQATLLATVITRAFVDHKDLSSLTNTLLVLAAVVACRGVVSAGFEFVGSIGAHDVMQRLRAQLLKQLTFNRPVALRDTNRGKLITAAVQGVDAVETYFARYMPQVVLSAVAPVAIIGWVFFYDWQAAIILTITFPLVPIFMVLVGKAAEHKTKQRWDVLVRLGSHFLDVVTGLLTLKVNNRADAQTETIAKASDSYRRETMATLRIGFLSALVLELLSMLAVALVAATVGVQLAQGRLGLQAGLTVLLLAPELYLPLRQVGVQYHASKDAIAAAETVFEVVDMPAAVPRECANLPAPCPKRSATVFTDVSFTYPDRDIPALDGVSLTLQPGESVAVVGESGSGKSTLASLLLRTLKPSAGVVSCDGVDINDVNLKLWHQQVFWLPQRPTLFSGSVFDNVALGCENITEQMVWAALQQASAERFVEELPQRLDTVIGNGGRQLSLGQAQRIAIARAFLRKPSLVVLDEPTAHLDGSSAAAVTDSIGRLVAECTTLLITHDINLTALVNRSVLIDNGRLMDAPAAQ